VAFVGATLADLADAVAGDVEYEHVLVVGPTGQHHGYRCGDKVWVQRRGLYYFVVPGPQSFVAYVTSQGPDGEADFATNHYWVREIDNTITYTDNAWTATGADRTQTDPTGSGGRFGRWVDAQNLAEASGSHVLSTVGGVVVVVSMAADPATGEPCYFFERLDTNTDVYIETVKDSESPTPGSISPCSQIRFLSSTTGTSIVVSQDGATADHALVTLTVAPDPGQAYPPESHTLLDGNVHSDTVAAAVEEGALIYGNATPKWAKLAKGSDDQILRMNGNVPNWEDLPTLTASQIQAAANCTRYSLDIHYNGTAADSGTLVSSDMRAHNLRIMARGDTTLNAVLGIGTGPSVVQAYFQNCYQGAVQVSWSRAHTTFTLSCDASGNLVWAITSDTTADEWYLAITIDDLGFAPATGYAASP
jgi:hypothetical protein